MPNGFKKLTPFLPHHWLELKGLSRLYLFLFYATLAVGLYAGACWLETYFQTPQQLALNSAPLRRLYGLAVLQAGLACLVWLFLHRFCRTLQRLSSLFKTGN